MKNSIDINNIGKKKGIADYGAPSILGFLGKMTKSENIIEWMSASSKSRPSFHSMGDAMKKTPAPRNGAWCVIHSINEDDEGSWDSWDIVKWFEKDTAIGIWKGTEHGDGGAEGLLEDLLGGRKSGCQLIKEDGFYWKEGKATQEDGLLRWHRVSMGEIDAWLELPAIAREFAEPSKESEAEAKKPAEGIGKGGEAAAKWDYRLYDGSLLHIGSVPSKDWKDGKPLPAGVGAFRWLWLNRESDIYLDGSFTARFEKPGDGKDWDLHGVGDQLARWIMANCLDVEDPTGLYDEIEAVCL